VAPSFYDFLFTNRLTLAVLLFLKELLRCRKIYMAMEKGFGAYNGHLLLTAFIGTCGPCGGGFIKQSMALARVSSIGGSNTSFAIATKCSAFFSVLYTLEKSGLLVKLWKTVSRPQIILIQTPFMFSQAFLAKCGYKFDPFALPEKVLCEVFFSMGRDLTPEKKVEKKSKKSKKND